MKPTSRAFPRPWGRSAAAIATAVLLIPALAPFAAAQDQTSPPADPPAANPPQPAPAAPTPTPSEVNGQAPSAAGTSQTAAAASSSSPSVVQLSPFEVNAAQEQGYFAPSTLAGTRMNTNISDLGASITVVTKQQLENTNSVNITGVFKYEANTQGAATYVPTGSTAVFRGEIGDVDSGGGGTTGNFTSALANGTRIRGVAAPDQEEDDFYSIDRLPFDTYNVQSVEIDRGPNAIMFGSGSPAGIVNNSRQEANTTAFSGQAQVQTSSWGGFREDANFNFPLIPNTLGIYVAQVYDSQGFEQKPSSDLLRRQYAAITYFPFKSHKTKIKFSFENYNDYSNDPNTTTPEDLVTPWLAAGRPVWNTLTDQVTYLNTGQTSEPYALSTTSPNYVAGGPLIANLTQTTSPYFVPGMTEFSNGHEIMFFNQGSLLYTYRGEQSGFSNTTWMPAVSALTPSQYMIYQERLMESTTLPLPYLANGNPEYAVWQYPSVTSKSIYDWSSINTLSLDNTQTDGKTYYADLQQQLLPDDFKWGSLNLDVGWFRQELTQLIDAPLSQANAPQIYVDLSEFLPNGQPNPHVGQPFMDAYQADVYSEPEINNNWRAMLEYGVDLQDKVPSWLSWLGHHRFMTMFYQHDDVQTNLRYRPAIDGSDPNDLYLPLPSTLNQASGYGYPLSDNAIEQVYYLNSSVGNPNGSFNLSPGFMNRPGYGGPENVNVTTYDYATNSWIQEPIHMDSDLFATGGLAENLQDIKQYFWQSWFWNDRIVGSLGISDDEDKNRNTVFPTVNPTAVEYTNGFANTPYWYNEGPWSYLGGNTSLTGVVVHPFKNWAGIDNAANDGNLLAGFLRAVGFTFNKSNNFNPPAGNYTDYFGNTLGKPAGTEKDYGVEIATPDNKFYLRATWYTTSDLNAIYSSTAGARILYMDQTHLKDWATEVVEIENGESPSDPNFNNQNVYPLSASEQNQISQLTGLPYNFGGNVGANNEYVNPQETENLVGKGVEIEAEYNPLPNWTMKFTWGHQVTSASDIDTEGLAWINSRLPYWEKAAAPAGEQGTYTLSTGQPLYLGNFWQAYGYDSNITGPGNASGYFNSQDYYQIVVASALAVDTANDGTLAPNQTQYSWTYLTDYTFDRGRLKGLGVGGAVEYDGQTNAGYYGDTANLNSLGQIASPNINEPIYVPGRFHLDLWASYQFELPWSKLNAQVQFNVSDVTSNGYLQPISFNFDGSPAAEMIVPPRQYALTLTVNY